MHLSTLWRGTLKRVGAHFGTGVLSYFLFVRTLLLYNSIMALLVGLFVVLPQATQAPELPPARQNFSGLELLSGEVSRGGDLASRELCPMFCSFTLP